eukprot:357745-Chlamydomonas_euryale.AAC.2
MGKQKCGPGQRGSKSVGTDNRGARVWAQTAAKQKGVPRPAEQPRVPWAEGSTQACVGLRPTVGKVMNHPFARFE